MFKTHWPSLMGLIFAFTFTANPISAQRGPVDFYDCTGKQDANYVHPSDCSKFIACVAGRYAYEMDCSAGLNYDPMHDRCDYPELVGCIIDSPEEIRTTTTANPPNTTTANPTTPATSSTESSTSRTTTTPVASATPPRTTTTVSTSTSTVPPIYNCSGLPDGNYRHPSNCGKFIACVAGHYAYEMDCPANLHYDPRTNRCDYPEVVGCDPNFTTFSSSSTTNTGQTETSVLPNTSTSSVPPEQSSTTAEPDSCDEDCQYVGIDCHLYYSCINFTRKEYHECPYEQGLAFNPALKVCDRIENVEACRPETTSTTAQPPEEECGCEYKPHETDCSKYYFCSDSCKRSSCEVRSCPGDLLWSADFYGDGSSHQQCTLPENASCASIDSGSARLEFKCLRKSDGLYRNEHNCRSYWKCKDGIALLYACPKGFIYNPHLKSCDFPGRALKYCTNTEI